MAGEGIGHAAVSYFPGSHGVWTAATGSVCDEKFAPGEPSDLPFWGITKTSGNNSRAAAESAVERENMISNECAPQ